ncbi:10401_t:CDS:2, partial [Entrophospora sp. SA101]
EIGHFSAKCHYCAEAWTRGKPELLKGHLALHCSAVPSITNYFDSSAEVDTEITAAMAEDDDLFEYSEDNDLFEYGEEEEGEDQNEKEDESL